MNLDVTCEVVDLVVEFESGGISTRAVDRASFCVRDGRTTGIVGESGCGKSVTALSVMGLLPKPAGVIASGKIIFEGSDLVKASPREMHSIRGKRISMIFQEPLTALNPVQMIGKQLGEVFSLHFPEMTDLEIFKSSAAILEKVGISAPEKRLTEYPHQLSGGMRQRVMIAMALACKPDLLIADEPTTALDMTIQAQILELMKELQEESGMSIVFITHDLGVIAELCDDVVVMYAGQVMERANVVELFENPLHPYTRGLLDSIPRLERSRKTMLRTIPGVVPDLLSMPGGCRFSTRCSHVKDECLESRIDEVSVKPGHHVRCVLYGEES